MQGLSFRTGVGGGFGGGAAVGTRPPPATGSSVAAAAFGPGATTRPRSSLSSLSPTNTGGLAFWASVGGVALLILIHHSLPK